MKSFKITFRPIFFLVVFFAVSIVRSQPGTVYHNYLLRAIDRFVRGHYDSTIYYLHQSLGSYAPNSSISIVDLRKDVYIFMTHSFKALGLRDSALFYANNLIDIALFCKDSSLQADYLYTVATIYSEHNASWLALQHYSQAGQLAEKIGMYSLAATAYGAASVECTNNAQALKLVERSLHCSQLQDDKAVQGGNWCRAASIYYQNSMLPSAMQSYRRAMECFMAIKDTNSYKMAHSGLMFLFDKTAAQDSAWISMNSPEVTTELTYSSDSLALPTSMQGLKLDLLTSNFTAGERAVKLNILAKQY